MNSTGIQYSTRRHRRLTLPGPEGAIFQPHPPAQLLRRRRPRAWLRGGTDPGAAAGCAAATAAAVPLTPHPAAPSQRRGLPAPQPGGGGGSDRRARRRRKRGRRGRIERRRREPPPPPVPAPPSPGRLHPRGPRRPRAGSVGTSGALPRTPRAAPDPAPPRRWVPQGRRGGSEAAHLGPSASPSEVGFGVKWRRRAPRLGSVALAPGVGGGRGRPPPPSPRRRPQLGAVPELQRPHLAQRRTRGRGACQSRPGKLAGGARDPSPAEARRERVARPDTCAATKSSGAEAVSRPPPWKILASTCGSC